MKTSSKPQNRLILVLPTVALAAAYGFFSFLPGQKAIAELRAELDAADAYIEQTRSIALLLQPTSQEFDRTLQHVRRWGDTSPEGAELSTLFGHINQLAKAAGVTTTHFEPQTPICHARIRRVDVTLECTARVAELGQFLHDLEKLDESIWIEDLEIVPESENTDFAQCTVLLAIFADNLDNSDQVNHAG